MGVGMTTKVLIINLGPQQVDVIQQDCGGGKGSVLKRLHAGEHLEVYSHIYANVFVQEVRPSQEHMEKSP
jgi:hypothetical protein